MTVTDRTQPCQLLKRYHELRWLEGQRQITGLGIYQFGARFYDPTIGRFIQPDTIIPDLENPQTLNPYAYVYNNPINTTDPTGNFGKNRDDKSGYRNKITMRKVKSLEKKWKDEKSSINWAPVGTSSSVTLASIASGNLITLNSISSLGSGSGKSGSQNSIGSDNIGWSFDLLNKPFFWDALAWGSQTIAKKISTIGMGVEIGSTVAGCIAGSALVVGGAIGCGAGWSLGVASYVSGMNEWQNGASSVSTIFTAISDLERHNTRIENNTLIVGQSTTDSLVLSGAANLSPEATIDTYINYLALTINEDPNRTPLYNLGTIHTPFFSLQFGNGN